VIGNCFAQLIGHRGLRPASSWLHYNYSVGEFSCWSSVGSL